MKAENYRRLAKVCEEIAMCLEQGREFTIQGRNYSDPGETDWANRSGTQFFPQAVKYRVVCSPRQRWINIYASGTGDYTHANREDADTAAEGHACERLACLCLVEDSGQSEYFTKENSNA